MFNIPFTHFGTKQIFGARLFYLGNFTSLNSQTENRIYTSTYDSLSTPAPFFDSGTGFNTPGTYWGFVDKKGRILISGFFTTYKGTTVNRIVRLTPKGDIDKTFNTGTGFNADTRWIAEDSQGRIYVAGNFTTYKGASVNRMIRLFEDGSRDMSFVPPAFNGIIISGVIVDDDTPVVVGYFSTPASRIVKLTDTGTVDSSFNVGTGFTVSATGPVQIKIDNLGRYYVVGHFTAYRGTSSNGIVRILSNGDIDTSFNIGTGFTTPINTPPYTLTIQEDGKLVVGGFFTSYNGTSANRLLRLDSNGIIDNSFPLREFVSSGTPGVRSVVEDSAGNLYIGGLWDTYDGQPYKMFIKTDSNGVIDTNYLGNGTMFNAVIYHVIPYNTTVDN
jgi:hypothetical protein